MNVQNYLTLIKIGSEAKTRTVVVLTSFGPILGVFTPQIVKAEVIFFFNEDMFYLILILEMS